MLDAVPADITLMRYRHSPRSFKFKLVAYFVLLSLLPAAATYWGFTSVAQKSEVRRVDARLQAGLRAAVAAFDEDLAEATREATALARDPVLQRALVKRDAAAVADLLRHAPNVRVESGHVRVGVRPTLAAERRVGVVGAEDVIGHVVASVTFDRALLQKVKSRSGLGDGERFVVVQHGRLVTGRGWTQARLDVPPERPATVELDGERVRVLVAGPLDETASEPALGVLAPHDSIDEATSATQRRLFAGVLVALLLIASLAYLEGRSIVRTVSSIARAANGIARGKLDERVPVRGRDELARLGNAFNQMAEQLQQRLEELESERRRLSEAVSRFGEALAATHDADQLRQAVVETAVEATGASGGMLIGSDGQVAEVGAPGSGADRLELPLRAGQRTFGTLFLFGRNFDADARATAASLVAQAVIALDNAELHRVVERQALVDGLTGLANRRHAEDVLSSEIARAGRFGAPLSIVIGDLDDFKSVNDGHGHPVGDAVLREFAHVLEGTAREVDHAARWGGEEFLLVLPGTDADGAVQLAERIRLALADRTLVTPEGVPVRITASFGVAEHSSESDASRLVAAADAALYQAKRAGKNRSELARFAVQCPGASLTSGLRLRQT
jgi:diguanylate cyclase (GGDEF)-like protein